MANPKALEIARTYVDAIAAKDVEKIVSLCSADVVCNSPIGHLQGTERFRAFHVGFAQMSTNLTILAVFGDETQAVVVYDVETYPVPHATTAEHIKVEDGKLVRTDVIYDATPFAAYMASVQPH